MMEYRARTKLSEATMDAVKGSFVQPDMVKLLVTGEARVLKPDGKLLLVYLPGVLKGLATDLYPHFTKVRATTANRGYASGSKRTYATPDSKRGNTVAITSSILGSIDMDREKSKEQICRLTRFTAHEVNTWTEMQPMFAEIAKHFEAQVPDRYAAQVREAERTQRDWVIEGTPFTTITINNTYPTGIHTDKGDLDAGFSTLGVIRRGNYTGGWLTFPQYGAAVDMQDGDLLLMDAHEWHGNTALLCSGCGVSLRMPNHRCEDPPGAPESPERISIVSYFRTKMTQCGTPEEELRKQQDLRDAHNLRAFGLEYGEV